MTKTRFQPRKKASHTLVKKVLDICLYNTLQKVEVLKLKFGKQRLLIQFVKKTSGNFALKLGKPMELSLELNHSVNGQNLLKTISNKSFCEVHYFFQ
jgi:hypothetical protein